MYTEEIVMLNIYAKYGRGSVYSCIPLDGRRCWVMSRAPWKPDGHCQFDELERYMREEIEKPEKERRETENTFIGGVRGNIIDVDCDAGRERGYEQIKEDITIICTYMT
ncbi:MAG: hypothetical protein OCU20_00930 [Methanophagales archaeon]|nr:hypothetical protein [Methanophagales archaeon]